MDIIIAADIFGHTPALERLAARLGSDCIKIVTPYDQGQTFSDEDNAYKFFTTQTDISSYGKKISDLLISDRQDSKDSQTLLVGFSAGAAAVWTLSDNPQFSRINKAFCFYGSQIRNHIDICPVFPVDLIFPGSEPHFDIGCLINDLSGRQNVSASRETAGLHGFMNELSKNYDKILCSTHLEQINSWIHAAKQ